MKVSKSELKSIIKECLIEILAEGIGEQGKTSLTEAAREATSRRQAASRPMAPAPQPSRTPNELTQTLMTGGKNKKMGNTDLASIFADTEQRTLPAMLSQPDPESMRSSLGEGFPAVPFAPMAPFQPAMVSEPEGSFEPPVTTAWEAAAFGKKSTGMFDSLRPLAPPEPPKLSKAFLDQKVG